MLACVPLVGRAVKLGRIGEPIRVHALGVGDAPLEFSWRGRRHQVRQVIRLLEGGRYQLRTNAGLRCQVSRGQAFWQLDRLLPSGRTTK